MLSSPGYNDTAAVWWSSGCSSRSAVRWSPRRSAGGCRAASRSIALATTRTRPWGRSSAAPGPTPARCCWTCPQGRLRQARLVAGCWLRSKPQCRVGRESASSPTPRQSPRRCWQRGGRSTVVLAFPAVAGADAVDPSVMDAMAAAARHSLPGTVTHVTGVEQLSAGSSAGGSSVLTEVAIGSLAALVILAWVFGSVIAFVPLLTALVSILTMLLALDGLTRLLPGTRFNPAIEFIVAILGLGLSLDYAAAGGHPLAGRARRGAWTTTHAVTRRLRACRARGRRQRRHRQHRPVRPGRRTGLLRPRCRPERTVHPGHRRPCLAHPATRTAAQRRSPVGLAASDTGSSTSTEWAGGTAGPLRRPPALGRRSRWASSSSAASPGPPPRSTSHCPSSTASPPADPPRTGLRPAAGRRVPRRHPHADADPHPPRSQRGTTVHPRRRRARASAAAFPVDRPGMAQPCRHDDRHGHTAAADRRSRHRRPDRRRAQAAPSPTSVAGNEVLQADNTSKIYSYFPAVLAPRRRW